MHDSPTRRSFRTLCLSCAARTSFAFLLFLSACGSAWESEREGVRLLTRDGRELDGVSPVSQLVVEGLVVEGLTDVRLEDVWLVRGEVSAASSKRVGQRDVPETLEAVRESVMTWREGRALVLAPTSALTQGETYSVVVLGVGRVGQVVVSADPVIFLERLMTAAVHVGDVVPYCAPAAFGEFLDVRAALPPSSDVEIEAGFVGTELASTRCVGVHVASAGWFVPPALAGDVLLDPAPFEVSSEAREASVERPFCARGASWGECVRVRDGALEVDWGVGTFAFRATPLTAHAADEVIEWVGERLLPGFSAFGPLLPETEYRVEVARLAEGALTRAEVVLASGPATGRVVVNEVLANPAGVEPKGEWIELLNVGAAAVDLEGFRVRDGGGETVLPRVRLEPGEFGLVVREDFEVDVEMDVVPDARARRVVVTQIGKSGLSNSGEALELVDANGRVISRVPAIPADNGVSVARLDPWLPDDARSFAAHGDPGASPGAPNRTESEVE